MTCKESPYHMRHSGTIFARRPSALKFISPEAIECAAKTFYLMQYRNRKTIEARWPPESTVRDSYLVCMEAALRSALETL